MTDGASEERVEGDPGTAALFAELAREGTALLREELALARAEMRQKLDHAALGSAIGGVGFGLGLGGVAALLAAAILGLSTVLSPWLAALAVGITALLFGALLCVVAWMIVQRLGLTPVRTLKSLREHAEWARERLH